MRAFVQGFGVVLVSFGLLAALFYGGWFLEQKRDLAETATSNASDPHFLRMMKADVSARATRAVLLGLAESAAAVAVGALAALLLAKRNRTAAVVAVAAGVLAVLGVIAGSCLLEKGPFYLSTLASFRKLAWALAYVAPAVAVALAGAGYLLSRPAEPVLEEVQVGT